MFSSHPHRFVAIFILFASLSASGILANDSAQSEFGQASANLPRVWRIEDLPSIQGSEREFPYDFLYWIARHKQIPRSDEDAHPIARRLGLWLDRQGGLERIYSKLPEFIRSSLDTNLKRYVGADTAARLLTQNAKRPLELHEFSALVDRLIALNRRPRKSRYAKSWQEMEIQYWIEKYGGTKAFIKAISDSDPRRLQVQRIFETESTRHLNDNFKKDLEAFFDTHGRWPHNTNEGEIASRAEINLAAKVAKRGGKKAVLATMDKRFRRNLNLLAEADSMEALASAKAQDLVTPKEEDLVLSFKQPLEVLERWLENQLRFPNQHSKDSLEKRLGQWIMMKGGFSEIYPRLKQELKESLWIMLRGDPMLVIKMLKNKKNLTQHEEAVLIEARLDTNPIALFVETIRELKRWPSPKSENPREARIARFITSKYGSRDKIFRHLPNDAKSDPTVQKAFHTPTKTVSPGRACRELFRDLSGRRAGDQNE